MTLKNLGYAAFFGAAAFGLALTSGGVDQAKAEMPIFCVQPSAPVCGAKGGMKFTYDNSCYAMKDGAKVVSKGACKSGKMMSKKKMSMKKM